MNLKGDGQLATKTENGEKMRGMVSALGSVSGLPSKEGFMSILSCNVERLLMYQQGSGIVRKGCCEGATKGQTLAREVWSTEEEANMRPGHFWTCKFGTVPGIMTFVEKKFEMQVRKWDYKGTRY